jgi:hypothetical protein
MCRALRWAAGVLLALDVSVLAGPASAQTPAAPPQDAPTPVRTVRYQERVVPTEGQNRLEEMKVQLALLADVATFPYYVGVRASGGNLELSGYVPDTMVKQLALELARRNTFLKVTDGLKIQSNLNARPSLRGVEFLQKEGEALVARSLGATDRPQHLAAQPNGMVTVEGSVNSVEEKLAVSRLFRQLTGCTGVLNQLTVQPVLRDGQRVVRVTRDGALTTPEAALKTDSGTVSAASKAPALLPTPKWGPVPSPKVDIKEEELHLPSPAGSTPRSQPATPISSKSDTSAVIQATPVSKSNAAVLPAEEAKPGAVDVLAAPKVPASWSRGVITLESDPPSKSPTSPTPKASGNGSPGVISWESELPAPKPQTSTAPKVPAKGSPGVITWESELPKPQTNPAPKAPAHGSRGVIVWDSEPPKSPKGPATSAAAPTPPATVNRAPAAMRWESQMQAKPAAVAPPPPPPVVSRTPPIAKLPDPSQAEVSPQPRAASKPPTAPRITAAPQVPVVPREPAARPANGSPATSGEKPPLVSPRRWPPAFDIRPPVSEWGQPGSIAFEEEQEPPASPAPKPLVPKPVAPNPVAPQLVESEPLAPQLAAPVPLVASPPPPRPAPRQSLTHSRTNWSAWPVSPTDLKQRVESMCGRLAKDVQVQPQRDGTVLVRVKVANATAERQLTNKILTIPEITGPNVRLEIVVGK